MYGKVSSAWTLEGERFELTVEIPANTRATLRLPRAELGSVTEGGSPLGAGSGSSGRRQDGNDAVVEVGSGRYRFSYLEAR
jgi:alpha-L-rhamnosidase